MDFHFNNSELTQHHTILDMDIKTLKFPDLKLRTQESINFFHLMINILTNILRDSFYLGRSIVAIFILLKKS